MSTDEELRERYEQEQNETPAVVDDGGDQDDGAGDVDVDDQDGGGGFGAIPTPSVSRRQVALLAVVVAVVVAYYLYRQQDASSGGAAPDGEFTGNVAFEGPREVDDGGVEDDEIEVTVDSSDPMAADESVAEAFRDRGLIGGSD